METLEALRRKIEGAEDMHSIVRTMKSLAAVHIREYESAVEAMDEYVRTVELGLRVALGASTGGSLLLASDKDDSEEAGFVVFGSGHGMCGRFNEQMGAFAAERIGEVEGRRHRILALGDHVADVLRMHGRHVDHTMGLPGAVEGMTRSVRRLLEAVEDWRGVGVARVFLLYHRQESQARSEPRMRQLYPLDPAWLEEVGEQPWPGRSLPTFRTDPSTLMASLAREYFFVILYRAFAYSLAAEHAARLASMQTAEDRVRRRKEDLQKRFHREHQRTVTEEVLDIIGGRIAIEDPIG
jgi:F-type H+-transporting ATPase subunit gamma